MSTVRTNTFVPLPITSCLVKAEEILGPNRQWQSGNGEQARFLRSYFEPGRGDLSKLSADEIEAIASRQAAEINAFLTKKGFSIQLEEFDGDSFGVASVLDVTVTWHTEGEAAEVTYQGKQYPAFHLKDRVYVLEADGHAEPVVRIDTKNGDRVYITAIDGCEGMDLAALMRDIVDKSDGNYAYGYEGAVIPKVDLDLETDISWLVGMSTTDQGGASNRISQAKQQTKFKMNEKGARANSAAAIVVTRGLPSPPVVIDKPFAVSVIRPGLAQPILVGFVDADAWKDPGTL